MVRGYFSNRSQDLYNYSQRIGGSGLGLSICKHLVEIMGGTMEVKSVLGQGSTFTFNIPTTEMWNEECEKGNGEHRTLELEEQSFSSIQVLVAEDDEDNQKVISKMLKRLGCKHQVHPPLRTWDNYHCASELFSGVIVSQQLINSQIVGKWWRESSGNDEEGILQCWCRVHGPANAHLWWLAGSDSPTKHTAGLMSSHLRTDSFGVGEGGEGPCGGALFRGHREAIHIDTTEGYLACSGKTAAY